jgi:glucose/arabinose dehydrogenase
MRIPLIVLAILLAIGVFVWFVPFKTTTITEMPLTKEESTELTPITLVSKTITLADGEEATFEIADGFSIAVAAEDLGKARFMAMSPDNRMFLVDMVDLNLSREGRILILEDFNEETKQFENTSTYLSGLRGPNSVAFYTDSDGKDWIYLTLTDSLIRYPYQAGDTFPQGEPEVIATFPDYQSPTAIGVVWHITRTIVFHDDTLYVSVGSGCNVCEQPEDETRAVVFAMDPDGENSRVYVDGIKNAVGMIWAEGALYATENGVDHLGTEDPDDGLFRLEEGKHYGWPYCYESNGVKYEDTTQMWQREPVDCGEVPPYFAAFDPHSAPLGLRYFENAHPVLENSFLVALHGSFQQSIGNGYQIMRVSKEGEQEVFMDGFLNNEGERVARAVDILQKDENSFFMTDDFGGRLIYIYAE